MTKFVIILMVLGMVTPIANGATLIETCIGLFSRSGDVASPGAQIVDVEEKIRAIFNTPEAVEASWEDENLAEVDGNTRSQTANAVTVDRPGNEYPTNYNRTNRGLEVLPFFYPEAKVNPEGLQGKKVLDLAMGGGKYVEDLRATGIEAYGLDIALSSLQMKDVYVGKPTPEADGLLLSEELGRGHFIQADATHTGLASNQFDVIFSTYAMFEYDLGPYGNHDFLEKILTELHRITKIGGVIRISPLYENYTDKFMRQLVDKVDGLEISIMERSSADYDRSNIYIEIVKIH